MPWVMFIAFISSLVVPVGAVVGIMAYIKRTRVIQAGMEDGSPHSAVMDSLDQVHVRLDAMSHRLSRLEETLQLGTEIRRLWIEGPRKTFMFSEYGQVTKGFSSFIDTPHSVR